MAARRQRPRGGPARKTPRFSTSHSRASRLNRHTDRHTRTVIPTDETPLASNSRPGLSFLAFRRNTTLSALSCSMLWVASRRIMRPRMQCRVRVPSRDACMHHRRRMQCPSAQCFVTHVSPSRQPLSHPIPTPKADPPPPPSAARWPMRHQASNSLCQHVPRMDTCWLSTYCAQSFSTCAPY